MPIFVVHFFQNCLKKLMGRNVGPVLTLFYLLFHLNLQMINSQTYQINFVLKPLEESLMYLGSILVPKADFRIISRIMGNLLINVTIFDLGTDYVILDDT